MSEGAAALTVNPFAFENVTFCVCPGGGGKTTFTAYAPVATPAGNVNAPVTTPVVVLRVTLDAAMDVAPWASDAEVGCRVLGGGAG